MAYKKSFWTKLKTEYIKTETTLEELAEKYNIAMSTLARVSTSEKWSEKKEEFWKKTSEKTLEKSIEKLSDKLASRNERFLELSDKALGVISDFLNKGQFNKFVVKNKSVDEDGGFQEGYAVLELPVPNTKAFQEMIKSLTELQKGQRLAEGLDKPTGTEIPEPKVIYVEGIKPEDI